MGQANRDTKSHLQTVTSSTPKVPKPPDGLGLSTSNSCLVPVVAGEEQKMLKCDGGVP